VLDPPPRQALQYHDAQRINRELEEEVAREKGVNFEKLRRMVAKA
jgi:hypothetical protein